jgi:glycosyltransferase involved in cell wall biosynthesis
MTSVPSPPEHNITFLVFTYNEERRIEYILRCFQLFGRIVLLDDGSTDRTGEIARKYGAEVVRRPPCEFGEDEGMAKFALEQVHTPWVYWAYTDEILPKTLLRKLQEVAGGDRYKLVNIHRKNLHYGMPGLNLLSGFRSPRFFRKGHVDFTGNRIHQMGIFTGSPEEVLNLPLKDEYSIYHCSTYDIKKFEVAHSGYSDTESRTGGRFSPFRLLCNPAYFFLRQYVLKGGWRSGWGGFIYTMQYCFFYFNVQAKTWERENSVNLESIEKIYDDVKEKLLRG